MHLLLTSSSTVADISYQVGYNSPGTFSSRFRSGVGVSPIAFRQLGGYAPRRALETRAHRVSSSGATMRGNMRVLDGGRRGYTFVGLFRESIPQGTPASCTVLSGPGPFVLDEVPHGTWHVHAQAIALGAEVPTTTTRDPADTPYVGSYGPVVVRNGTPTIAVDLVLRPQRTLDPPVLIAPVDMRSVAMAELEIEDLPDAVSAG